MKKWQKWLLRIFGVIAVAIIIFVAVFWSTFSIIFIGTEELSGDMEAMPEAV